MSVTVEIENGRPKGYLTVTEFAKKLKKDRSCIWQMAKKGRIKTIKIYNHILVKEDTDIKYTRMPSSFITSLKALQDNDVPKYWISMRDFAKQYGIQYYTVAQAARRGKLKSEYIDGVRLIPVTAEMDQTLWKAAGEF